MRGEETNGGVRSRTDPESRSHADSDEDPRLEPALLDWYRARITSISSAIDASGEARDLEMKAMIEDSIGRRRRPSDESRRWLDQTRRSLVGREIRVASERRSDLFRSGRRMIRRFVGRSSYLHGRTSRTSQTRVLHAVADLQIGGAQQLVIDLAASAGKSAPHHVIAGSVGIRFRPPVPYTEVRVLRARVQRVFDRHQPEVIHLCHYHASRRTAAWYDLVARVAMERGVPIVQSHCVIGDP